MILIWCIQNFAVLASILIPKQKIFAIRLSSNRMSIYIIWFSFLTFCGSGDGGYFGQWMCNWIFRAWFLLFQPPCVTPNTMFDFQHTCALCTNTERYCQVSSAYLQHIKRGEAQRFSQIWMGFRGMKLMGEIKSYRQLYNIQCLMQLFILFKPEI